MLFWRISLIFTDLFWHIKGYCKVCFMSRAYFLLTDSFWNAALDMHAGELSNRKQKKSLRRFDLKKKHLPCWDLPGLRPSVQCTCEGMGSFPLPSYRLHKGGRGAWCLKSWGWASSPSQCPQGSSGLLREKTRSMCETVLRLCCLHLLVQHAGSCLAVQGNGNWEDGCVLTKECCFGSVQPVGSQMLRSHFPHPCWRALFLSCSVMTYSYRVPSSLRSQIIGMLTLKLELMLINLPIKGFFLNATVNQACEPFFHLFCFLLLLF